MHHGRLRQRFGGREFAIGETDAIKNVEAKPSKLIQNIFCFETYLQDEILHIVDIYTRFLPYEARVAVGVAGRETVEVSGSSNQ